MNEKDYYEILELQPSATHAEIKKAYRNLAMQYHPDKTGSDAYATVRYADIKEAYEVLTDPAKKEYYLQQRWYRKSTGQRRTSTTSTPLTILQQSIELEKYVSRLDHFRMDAGGLQRYLLDLAGNDTIALLNRFDEKDTNERIVSLLSQSAAALPFDKAMIVYERLSAIKNTPEGSAALEAAITKRKAKANRLRYQPLLLLVATLLICLLIFLLAKG